MSVNSVISLLSSSIIYNQRVSPLAQEQIQNKADTKGTWTQGKAHPAYLFLIYATHSSHVCALGPAQCDTGDLGSALTVVALPQGSNRVGGRAENCQ